MRRIKLIHRAPSRLGPTIPAPDAPSPASGDPPPLSATPAEMARAAGRLTPLATTLGVPHTILAGEGPLSFAFDDQIRVMAVKTAAAATQTGAILPGAAAVATRLTGRVSQLAEAHRLHLGAQQLCSDLGDTRALVGRREQRAQRALLHAVRQALARLPRGSDAYKALESDAAELLAWDAQRQAARTARAAQVRAHKEADAEALTRAGKAQVKAQALHDLSQGQPLSPEAEDALLDE